MIEQPKPSNFSLAIVVMSAQRSESHCKLNKGKSLYLFNRIVFYKYEVKIKVSMV